MSAGGGLEALLDLRRLDEERARRELAAGALRLRAADARLDAAVGDALEGPGEGLAGGARAVARLRADVERAESLLGAARAALTLAGARRRAVELALERRRLAAERTRLQRAEAEVDDRRPRAAISSRAPQRSSKRWRP